jgi:hypothetical protein
VGASAAAGNGYLLAAGPALPAGWYSAGSQLTTGGYYYGGPVTTMPAVTQNVPPARPPVSYIGGYIAPGFGVYAPQAFAYAPVFYAPTTFVPPAAPVVTYGSPFDPYTGGNGGSGSGGIGGGN